MFIFAPLFGEGFSPFGTADTPMTALQYEACIQGAEGRSDGTALDYMQAVQDCTTRRTAYLNSQEGDSEATQPVAPLIVAPPGN